MQGVQHTGRPDDRVPGEVQFLGEIEDPRLPGGGLRGLVRGQEDRLEVAQLLGDPLHLVTAEPAGVREHGEAVAAVGQAGEDIDMEVVHAADATGEPLSKELANLDVPT